MRVSNSPCEHASTAFYFARKSSDHICLASSKQCNWQVAILCKFSTLIITTIFLSILTFSYSFLLICKRNEISFVPPIQYLERIHIFLSTKKPSKRDSHQESEHVSNCETQARGSEKPSKFCEQIVQKQHFASTLKFQRTI